MDSTAETVGIVNVRTDSVTVNAETSAVVGVVGVGVQGLGVDRNGPEKVQSRNNFY